MDYTNVADLQAELARLDQSLNEIEPLLLEALQSLSDAQVKVTLLKAKKQITMKHMANIANLLRAER